jgi:hypothetical protein
MTRKVIPMEQRKISLTLSIPFGYWQIFKERGNSFTVDILKLGLWAHRFAINELTLNKMKEDYEEKIAKLQKIIEAGYSA